MTRVLVIYYTQSGETREVAKLFSDAFVAVGHEPAIESISPAVPYPFPWRSIRRFFDAMPESILGLPPPLKPLRTGSSARFDLVILCYPVWFLSPAPAVQALLKSPYAALLRDTDVITVSVSRAMWQRAALAMKPLLAASRARHTDSVAVTHQGSAITTLISTPRALLFGKSDRLLSVFPRPGISDDDRERLRRLAAQVATQAKPGRPPGESYLKGEPALPIKRWLAVPELLAWYCFYGSARVIRALGELHPALRAVGVFGFALFLLLLIVVGLPLTLLGALLLGPFIRPRVDAYIAAIARSAADPSAPEAPSPQNTMIEEMRR
jgi:hypothetical protein